ncbi:zinc-dependent alcohol dehydrogenase [Pedococcus sp. 5OH_020]|uniref:zinc-dependent alcohol dehydrogenase n=1 Tax=Pedococcus sp. 5OH_020 TaxID=2989814 RepID=UPI0022E9AF68|nr:alcohol dehydrogenase catalytic domain-containing protein [Pedococcus sp. 5OH_020]
MRAAVVIAEPGGKHLEVRQVPKPQPGPGQVLVQVAFAGVCGSDTHGFLDTEGTSRADGLIMSHEISGTIAEHGPGVSDPPVGTRVTVDPQVVCGQCPACRKGWISICDHKQVLGSSLRGFVQGGMAEYVVTHQATVHPVPPSVTDEQAALIEPLANALHTVRRAEVQPGDNVVVLGAGPLGLCMVQCLRNTAARVIAVTDPSETRRNLALLCGADIAWDPRTTDVEASVLELTSGRGADVVIESVGIEATYRQAITVVRKRGRVMFFGAVQPEVSLPLLPILHKELSLIGCTGANDETGPAIELVAAGKVDLSAMTGTVAGLNDAESAIRAQLEPGYSSVKLLIDPRRQHMAS